MVASNGPMPRIDPSRPCAPVEGMPGVAYTQDDAFDGQAGRGPQAERSGAALSPGGGIAEPVQQSASTPAGSRKRSSAAERMRLSRLRRRDGMRVVPFEVRDAEIEGLVAHGLLDPAQRNDREAIARALGNLIDRMPLTWWRVAARTGDRANYSDRYAR